MSLFIIQGLTRISSAVQAEAINGGRDSLYSHYTVSRIDLSQHILMKVHFNALLIGHLPAELCGRAFLTKKEAVAEYQPCSS